EMKISPKTEIGLTKMKQLAGDDKAFKFKLWLGNVWNKVAKLSSSKSSYEMDAGGVICGVRGTEFSMNYNPDTGKVDVHVFEGTVWTNAGGHDFTFHGGQGGTFTNGHSDNGNPPPGDQGNHGSTNNN